MNGGPVVLQSAALRVTAYGPAGTTLTATLGDRPLGTMSLTAEAGGPPNADALRGSVFLGLWEEELRHGARA